MSIHSYVLGALFIAYSASTTDATNDRNAYFDTRTHSDDDIQIRNNNNATKTMSNKTLLNWQMNRDDIPLHTSGDFLVQKHDIDEAVAEGLRRMRDLYLIREPQLYEMGLFLDDDEPAGRVSAINKPNLRAVQQSRYGYAAVQALLHIKQTYPEIRSRRNPELVSFLRTDAFDDQCPFRGTPRCPPAAQRYRTADGTCNNVAFPWKGASMLPMQRFLLPDYDDDVQSIRRAVRNGGRLPSPREVSIRIHRDRDVEMVSVTMMFVQWGQFIDHDITSTAQSRAFNASTPRCCTRGGTDFLPPEFTHPECLPIAVPEDDWFLGRLGIRCIEFVRSAPSARINCDLGWREQINQVTSYIDASTVYGSDPDRADSLRIFRNGLLQYGRTRRASLVPPDPPGGELCRMGALSTQCFRGGDARVGEQPGLTAFHTIWLRYHNRIAAVIGNLNPHWSDEKVYQEARRIIGALIQHITYKEFLPIVLGHEVMSLFDLNVERKGFYHGYDALVNPTPANSFSSAAFRFGHSLVQHSFMRSDAQHRLLVNNVTIHEELDNPENIWTFGSIDRLILGFCNQPSQRRDEFISRELTNHLFQQPGQPFGMDLAAINIQRGRDHGIPGYTAWREPCGLSPIRTWRELEPIMNFETIQRFRSLYEHVDDIDLYPGGLAEHPVRGGIVGPTFACIIAQQFSNLRKGDRFWYENGGFESSFTPAQLQQLRGVTFAQVLCQVLPEIESIQPFVFLSPDNFRNTRVSCDSRDMETNDLRPWQERRVSSNRPLEKPVQPQFPQATAQSKPVGPVSIPPDGSATRSIAINVNDHLVEFERIVERTNTNRPTPKPEETTRTPNISETVTLEYNDTDIAISRTAKGVIKRSASKVEVNPLDYEYYEDDIGTTEVYTVEDSRKDVSSSRKRGNQQRKRTTTKRTTILRPVSSDLNYPLKIDVTNITTSTIDLGPDIGRPNISIALHPKPILNIENDKTRPTIYYQTTRHPQTNKKPDQYYVLHPTVDKPTLYKWTANQGASSASDMHAPTELSKIPSYQVNINIHLISSTPVPDIYIDDQLTNANTNVHVVDSAYIHHEQSNPPTNNIYQNADTRPVTISSTTRPEDYRPRPSISSTSSYRPTTYNYDRFEDQPFSTSNRPQINRPSDSLLSMFDKLHNYPHEQWAQFVTKRPTHATSTIDKVKRPLIIPSYLYYNDGKYFDESQSEIAPLDSIPSDSYPNTNTDYHTDIGHSKFVKISSVLGSQYLSQSVKEQYIHTAQQKSDEIELQLAQLNDSQKKDMTDTDSTDIRTNTNTNISNEKIQIDVIPQESHRDDWILYDTIEEPIDTDEPEIEQTHEHLAQELPKPLCEFWKSVDKDT